MECDSQVEGTLNTSAMRKIQLKTKIWLLLVATGTLLCAGCATETAQQRDQRYNMTLQTIVSTAQRAEEQISGKPQKDWSPAETAAYNSMVLDAVEAWSRSDAERADQQRAALAAMGAGLQSAGASIQADAKVRAAAAQQGLQQPLWNQKPTGLGYRSWHNSDGSSGQYVPYPGGNGGTIYRSNGSSTDC